MKIFGYLKYRTDEASKQAQWRLGLSFLALIDVSIFYSDWKELLQAMNEEAQMTSLYFFIVSGEGSVESSSSRICSSCVYSFIMAGLFLKAA